MNPFEFMKSLVDAVEELQKPMSIEEAVEILDPQNYIKYLELPAEQRSAMEMKAKKILVEYVREKRQEAEK